MPNVNSPTTLCSRYYLLAENTKLGLIKGTIIDNTVLIIDEMKQFSLVLRTIPRPIFSFLGFRIRSPAMGVRVDVTWRPT